MRNWFFTAVLLGTILAGPGRAGGGTDDPAALQYNFGTVGQGAVVEHRFALHNDGTQPLRITNVQITPPLQLGKMPAMIPAGSVGALVLTLDTSRIEGPFSGELLVTLDGQAASIRAFSIAGEVIPPIEILPRPAFFLSTPRGVEKSATLEIVNHEAEPLELSITTPPADHYTARLQTVEEGQRYRLTVTIPAAAAAGRRSERLQLASSSALKPIVQVGVNTMVRERVHTFPDVVDFGRLSISELRTPASDAIAAQTLMVYQTGGRDFAAEPRSDIAGLAFAAERGPQGDRVQVTASLGQDAVPGRITGTITVQTNDPDFPQLQVPVTGEIVAD